jgi:hypothetical protein
MRASSIVLAFSLIAVLYGCKELPKTSDAKNSSDEPSDCFSDIDTSASGDSDYCADGLYKLVSDKYVISISSEFLNKFDRCASIIIDDAVRPHITVLVFDNNDADLTNFCSDVIIVNHHQPTRKVMVKDGQLSIGFYNTENRYGNMERRITVLIKDLLFIDPQSQQQIRLINELVWKAPDTGTPG